MKMTIERLSKAKRYLKITAASKIHLVIVLDKLMMIAVVDVMKRRSQETRFVHVAQKRNARLVVDQLQGDPLLSF